MSTANFKVRRATVDDLPQLIELWKLENMPWEVLEKKLTEFQVVDDGTGTVQGCWGIHIAGKQAKLHHEVFLQSDLADTHRELLWQRLQAIIHNHALIRLWTRETAPFYHGSGFHVPTGDQIKIFPAAFSEENATWTVLELRPEHEQTAEVDVDKEFEKFKEMERVSTEKAFEQAKKIRAFATTLAVLLFLGVVAGSVYVLRPDLFRRSKTPAPDTQPVANTPKPSAATNVVPVTTNPPSTATNPPPTQ